AINYIDMSFRCDGSANSSFTHDARLNFMKTAVEKRFKNYQSTIYNRWQRKFSNENSPAQKLSRSETQSVIISIGFKQPKMQSIAVFAIASCPPRSRLRRKDV